VKQAFFELGIKHELRSAYNGFELLDLLGSIIKENQPLPHFILLDLNMPKMNGFTVLEELAKNERLKQIPVYVLSTSSVDHDKSRSQDLGARAFYTKPISYQQLKTVIAEINKDQATQ